LVLWLLHIARTNEAISSGNEVATPLIRWDMTSTHLAMIVALVVVIAIIVMVS
jgi:uncharacterized protein with PQ loop repeat